MRSCVWRMPTSRSLKRPGFLVESSWVPGWSVTSCNRWSRREYECTIGDRIPEPDASLTRAAKRTQSLEFDRLTAMIPNIQDTPSVVHSFGPQIQRPPVCEVATLSGPAAMGANAGTFCCKMLWDTRARAHRRVSKRAWQPERFASCIVHRRGCRTGIRTTAPKIPASSPVPWTHVAFEFRRRIGRRT